MLHQTGEKMYGTKANVRISVILRAGQNAIWNTRANLQLPGVCTALTETLLAGDALGAAE